MRREALLLVPLALAVVGLGLLLPRGREAGPGVAPEAPAPGAALRGAPPPPEATAAPRAPAPPSPPPAAPEARDTSIRGRVRGDTGDAVAGARVVAVDATARGGTARVRGATTDAEGRFALRDVGGGRWSLSVEAPDYLAATVLDVAPGRADVEVTLASRGSIEATVLAPDGSPYAGEVDLRATFAGFAAGGAPAAAVPGGPVRVLRAASADGLLRLRGLPAGTWRVEAATAGEAPLVSEGDGTDVAVIDGRPSPVRLRLVPAGRLEGRLLDAATGAALAATGLDLRIEGPPATAGAVRATADADAAGRWRAEGLAGGTWTIAGRAANGAWVRERVELPAGGTVRHDLVARPGGTLRVRVVDDEGRPAAGVVVVLSTEDGTWKEPAEAAEAAGAGRAAPWRTDADGVHVRTSVPPGRVRVETLAGERLGAGGGVVAEVPAGGTAEAEVVVPVLRRRGR